MSHKRNFKDYINPVYDESAIKSVNVRELRAKFQKFQDELLELIPDSGLPEDPYMFNSHIGGFCRELDHAKDSFAKGLLAYYAKRQFKEDAKEVRETTT